MATEDLPRPVPRGPPSGGRPPLSFRRYLRDVALVAAVLAGALLLLRSRLEERRCLRERGAQAIAWLQRDTPSDLAQAEAQLLAIAGLDPGSTLAAEGLAELYALRWLDGGADADAPRAREWSARAERLGRGPDERAGAALLVLLADGKAAEVERAAAALLARAPSPRILDALARALRAQGRLAEARGAFQRAAELGWRNPRFACDCAELLLGEGEAPLAASYFARALQANPRHPRALVGRARAQIAQGARLQAAGEALLEVLKRPPEELSPRLRAQTWTGLSELRSAEQKPEAALEAADLAIAASPTFAPARLARGRALALLRRAAEAELAFREALARDPRARISYEEAARILADAGEGEKALALLASWTTALPEDERFHLAAGRLLARLGRPEEALARVERALALDPLSAAAHFEQGVLLLTSRKDLGAARAALTAAVDAQESFPEAWAALGEVSFARRDYPEGCRAFGQALSQLQSRQAPVERREALRARVRDRLEAEARDRAMASAWMAETAGFVR